MEALHIIWILIFIIVILIFIDLFKPSNKVLSNDIEKKPILFPKPQPILKPKQLIEKEWEKEVKNNKEVRFNFSNNIKDIKRDQTATKELSDMYIEARKEIPIDDPYACKAQSTSLPIANVNPRCILGDKMI